MQGQSINRAYYEREAALRTRRGPSGRRVDLRNEFVEVLRGEDRSSVIDFGAGPGEEVRAFEQAGFQSVGIDLAHGNGAAAKQAGCAVIQGSIATPPMRASSFDAGWSMSTVMHLPEEAIGPAIQAMSGVLVAGAPFVVGLWGGPARDLLSDHGIEGERRHFSLRPLEANRSLLVAAVEVQQCEVWDVDQDDWEYHVFWLRATRGK